MPALPDDGLDSSVEDIHQPAAFFAVGVAAHRRLVDRQLAAAGPHKCYQLIADNWQQGLGQLVPILVAAIGCQPKASGRTRS